MIISRLLFLHWKTVCGKLRNERGKTLDCWHNQEVFLVADATCVSNKERSCQPEKSQVFQNQFNGTMVASHDVRMDFGVFEMIFQPFGYQEVINSPACIPLS